jgi:hypothetical protein
MLSGAVVGCTEYAAVYPARAVWLFNDLIRYEVESFVPVFPHGRVIVLPL